MVHILTSLHPEATPIIEYFKLKKNFNTTEFEHFTSDNLSLSIAGVGGIKVASVFSFLFAQEKEAYFLLVGICGAKNNLINIGEIFLINKAIQNDSGKKFYPDIIFNHVLKENSIESFGKVITSQNLISEGDLIDMESAYFLEAAQFFMPPHRSHVLKIVSDHLNVKHITKDFISKIIEKNLDNINQIITILQEFSQYEQKILISNIEKDFLIKISENLKLTEYMKKEFFNLYKFAKVKKGFSTKELEDFLKYKITSKQERKKTYESLKNRLL
ncbi:MAG: hypothetical protein N2258_07585 [Brevinematales bacterium]|nr:hypothetical protein [Brevinematales bacterium]